MFKDDGFALFKRNIGKFAAIWRPGGRDDRLVVFKDCDRVLAIGICHDQLIVCGLPVALLQHIGNARREVAGLPRQLLVNEVSHLVAGQTRVVAGHRDDRIAQSPALDDVGHAHTDFNLATGPGCGGRSQRIGTAGAPGVEINSHVFFGDLRIGINDLEKAATGQIITNRGGDLAAE